MALFKPTACCLLLALPLASPGLERIELLPQDAALFRVSNVATFWSKLDAMYVAKLRKDEQFQEFSVAFGEKIKKKMAEGEIPPGLRLLHAQLLVLKGEIAYAATEDEEGQELYHLAAAATEEEYLEAVNRYEWFQGDAPLDAVKSEFRGVEIIRSIANGGTPEEESCWRAHVENTALTGSRLEWIEQSIVRLQNETVVEPSGNAVNCRFPIRQWILQSIEETEKDEREATRALYNALGILNIDDYRLDLEIKGRELVLDGKLAVSDLGKGLFLLLDSTPGIQPNEHIIPPNASSFLAGKTDLHGFWRKLPEMLSSASPKLNVQVNAAILGVQQLTGVDIGNDLLAHAGNEFTLYTIPATATNQSILVSLELKDGRSVEQSINRLFASPIIPAGIIEVAEFRGSTVYSTTSTKPDARPLALCVAKNQLLFGHDGQIRESIQRLESKRTRQPSPLLAKAALLAPDRAFGIGAADHQRVESLLYVNASDSKFSAGIGISSDTQKKDGKEVLGENEISFNYISSFLENSYNFAEIVPGGIHHRIAFQHAETQGEP